MNSIGGKPKPARVRPPQAMTSAAAVVAASGGVPAAASERSPEGSAPPREHAASAIIAPTSAIETIAADSAETATTAAAALDASLEAVSSPAVHSDPTPAAEAAAQIERGMTEMATMVPPVNETTDKAQAMFGDMQGRMKSTIEKSAKAGEELVDFAKGNVEALMASARVAAKAGETFGQDAADYSRKSFEQATAAFKSFATAKSPTELFQLQSDFAKASFDQAVAEASRMSETMMKFAGDFAQPLSNRYALAAEKMKTLV